MTLDATTEHAACRDRIAELEAEIAHLWDTVQYALVMSHPGGSIASSLNALKLINERAARDWRKHEEETR